jgi:hypothetical protein
MRRVACTATCNRDAVLLQYGIKRALSASAYENGTLPFYAEASQYLFYKPVSPTAKTSPVQLTLFNVLQ